ncbi:MAG: hypothetical protein AAGN82_19010 [Myxococcota bacterium]
MGGRARYAFPSMRAARYRWFVVVSAALFLTSVLAMGGPFAPVRLSSTARSSLPADDAADDTPRPWCAPELKAIAENGPCFYAGEGDELVVFLHGLVQVGAGWQHQQQRAIVRGAKREGYSVLMPKGLVDANPKYPGMVSWPTSAAMQRDHEKALLAGWHEALEQLADESRTFSRVYVVGFSNGAYYGASLGLRGAFGLADGVAVFAGGGAWGAPPGPRRVPFFVGLCTKDATHRDAERLVRVLKKAKWPHRVERRRVGHTMADAHLDHAIIYLRQSAPTR